MKMEESTSHPRIAISDKIIKFLLQIQLYTQEEADKAISIENRSKNGENVSNDDMVFYQKMMQMAKQELFEHNICSNLLYKCDDDVWCLSYLYCLDIRSYISEQTLWQILQMLDKMKQELPIDYEKLPKAFPDIDLILDAHRRIVEQKLVKYSNYIAFSANDIKHFETQEKVLKKYVWSMVYHNYMCRKYNKLEYYINT